MNSLSPSKQELRVTKLNYHFQVEGLKLRHMVLKGLEWQSSKLILYLTVMPK